MTRLAYHASHEQFPPSELLRYIKLAEEVGFGAIHSSDHLQPWSMDQGESGHIWSWLGAAMQVSSLPFGLICAPGPRHHPVIVAQALATLSEMFPNRLWAALGSGEAINERVLGGPWPSKPERNQRLETSFYMIRDLLAGKEVTQHKPKLDGHFGAERARIYSRPADSVARPPLLGAALTPDTARWLGGWAEGLLTISHPLPELYKLIDAFCAGGGTGKPVYIKMQFSYARDVQDAVQGAFKQWRTNIFESSVLSELWLPEHYEAAAEFVSPEDVIQSIPAFNTIDQMEDWLKSYQKALEMKTKLDTLILHNVHSNQEDFLTDFRGVQVDG